MTRVNLPAFFSAGSFFFHYCFYTIDHRQTLKKRYPKRGNGNTFPGNTFPFPETETRFHSHLPAALIYGLFCGNTKYLLPERILQGLHRNKLSKSRHLCLLKHLIFQIPAALFLTELLQGGTRLPLERAAGSRHIERMVGHGFC